MLATEMNPEDSEYLLNELNRATEELMSISNAAFGGEHWQAAHRRQQSAFANWLLYIRKDPVFQNRSKKLLLDDAQESRRSSVSDGVTRLNSTPRAE